MKVRNIMQEEITNELIQYKTGFMGGKNEVVELTRLGKTITFDKEENPQSTEWYEFGYRDAVEYFCDLISKNVDIAAVRVRDVVKELFAQRVIKYNSEKEKEVPISTFRINK